MKYLIVIIFIIFIIAIIGLTSFFIDYTRVKENKLPIFCISFDNMTYADGGTKQYFGIGYKVIAYKKMNGYNGIHIGTYFLKYDEDL